MGPAQAVAGELMGIPDFGEPETDFFKVHRKYVQNFKKAVLVVAGAAAQKLMMELAKEQEVLMNVADMLIETYAAESVLLRVEKIAEKGGDDQFELKKDMAQAYIFDAAEKINQSGREALMSFAEGDELRMMLMGMKRFTKMEPFNIKQTRRNVAEALIAENRYIF
jgi:hypothetical protein